MHEWCSFHLWCKRINEYLMNILPQIRSSSPQLMSGLLLHPTKTCHIPPTLQPPGKALLAQKCWALLQTQSPHCSAACDHLSRLSLPAYLPHRVANGRKRFFQTPFLSTFWWWTKTFHFSLQHPTLAVSCPTCCLLWLSCYLDPVHLGPTHLHMKPPLMSR